MPARIFMTPVARLGAVALLTTLVIAALATGPALSAQAGRERTIFVTAVDDKDEPVEGLGPEAFVVQEDGRRREVLRVSTASEPIDIALLVDNSAATQTEIPFMREALSRFVATMAPGNQIAVITLADRPTIRQDYTDDPKKLSDAVNGLFAMQLSGTTLLDAIHETSRGLGRRETPRAAMIVVTTDGPEFSNRYFRAVVDDVVKAGAALHTVTIGRFLNSSTDQSIQDRVFLLDAGPRDTGGVRINLLAPNGLDQAMQRLARHLESQYKVVYGRPESLIPPEKIEVSSARPSVTMRGTPARDERTGR